MISVTRKKLRQFSTLPPSCSSPKVASASTMPASAASPIIGSSWAGAAASVPYRKTTASLPSRAMASADSTSTPHQLRCCAWRDRPDSRSRLSVRPCARIHSTICTISAAATKTIAAWNKSWCSASSPSAA